MKTSSLILCLCCWHAVFASTVVVSAFASSSPSQLLRLPSGCYTMTKSTAYYSPPGSFISSGSVVAAAMPFLSQHHYRHHQQQHHGVLGAAATTTTTTRLHLLSIPRGGGATTATTAEVATTITTFSSTIITTLTAKLSQWTSTPNGMFNLVLALLGMSTAVLKLYNNNRMMLLNNDNDRERGEESVVTVVKKDPKVKSLQMRFLTVFWLLRMADWLQGPYFYQVYASKTFFGATTAGSSTVVVSWVSRLFLTGFASTALFGPFVGRMCDSYGRKAGTLAFSLLYSLGAISTKSNVLGVLLLGRVLGGIGTSLLFSAPEAWLVGEAGKEGVEGSLGETFGLAYAGDSIVAILAGQMAGMAASTRGPTGPFELSVGFLVMGAVLASFLWKENVAGGGGSTKNDNETKATKDSNDAKPTIRDAIQVVKSDPKIMLVGAIQSLFEAAMYIFVLNWPPAVSKAISSYFAKFSVAKSSASAPAPAAIINTPYGTVFSCFMACCLLGSTVFGQLTSSKKVDKSGKRTAISTESFAVGMLGLAALAMGSATLSIGTSTPRVISSLTSLPVLSTIISPIVAVCSKLSTCLAQPGAILSILMLSLFLFESCVGMYFPTIGTLRSKFFPESHRSVVMNLFGIPLNAMVVSVFLSIERLGVQGALGVSTTALAVAAACGYKLKRLVKDSESK